jgi:hypothetical protein
MQGVIFRKNGLFSKYFTVIKKIKTHHNPNKAQPYPPPTQQKPTTKSTN